MGFLSKYSATEKIDLGDGFNIEVRKYLSSAQRGAAEKKLVSAHMIVNQETQQQNLVSDVDATEFRLELCAQAIVSWNLTDEQDQLLPFQPIEALRSSIARLPTHVVDLVVKAVDSPEDDSPESKSEENGAPVVIDGSVEGQQAWPAGVN